MELSVNPYISTMVSYDNKIINIEGMTQEGIMIKEELEKNNAIGKTVEEFISQYIDLLNAKGYLVNATDVNLAAQSSSVESIASQALTTKLEAIGSSAIVNVDTITRDFLNIIAKNYLFDYTEAQIEAMDANDLSNLILEKKEEINAFENIAYKDFYLIIREKVLLDKKN